MVFGISSWFPLSMAALIVMGRPMLSGVVVRSTLVQRAGRDARVGVNSMFITSISSASSIRHDRVAARHRLRSFSWRRTRYWLRCCGPPVNRCATPTFSRQECRIVQVIWACSCVHSLRGTLVNPGETRILCCGEFLGTRMPEWGGLQTRLFLTGRFDVAKMPGLQSHFSGLYPHGSTPAVGYAAEAARCQTTPFRYPILQARWWIKD